MSDGQKALAEKEESDRIAAGGKSNQELWEEERQRKINNWKMRLETRVDKLILAGASERDALLTVLAEHMAQRRH